MIRKCCQCGRLVSLSFGATHAGDFIKACNGQLSRYEIREFCGYCVLQVIINEIIIENDN